MDHEFLKRQVEEACDKLVNDGIDRCSDKDVTLACFGLLAFNGLSGIQQELSGLRKFGWKVLASTLSLCITTLVGIIIILIFI
jgi:hypothetical protein